MKLLIPALLMMAMSSGVFAAIKSEKVEYQCGDTVLEGYLAWDDAVAGKRPGVMVVHEWYGLNDYAKKRAEQLAALGYVVFAADMYGKGVLATTPEEARKLATALRQDRKLMRLRAEAGLETLKKQPLCDPSRVAAMGYCFGGGTVLELARDGADVKGVVSFHGNLDTPNPADAKNIRGKVLVLTGADDPSVPPKQVEDFMAEMRAAGVDYQIVSYGGAVHAFTNPASGNDPKRGAAYNEAADRRSWEAMKQFFTETLGK